MRRALGVLVLVVLGVVGVFHLTALPDSINSSLQSTYYRVAAAPDSTQRVVLVEADDATVESWGDPMWSAERRQALLEEIDAGQPAAIVVLDPRRMFGSESVEPTLDGTVVVDVPTYIDPGGSNVDVLDRDDVSWDQLRPALEAAGLELPSAERLWIHYLRPPSRLPTVALHRVEQGEVPTTVFENKLVVVGLTSLTHRDAVPTAVGALTSPEVVTHALAMLADGRVWIQPSWPMRAAAWVLLVLITVRLLRGTAPGGAVVRVAAVMGVLVLVDLVLFSQGLVRWGVASELVTVFAVLVGHWYVAQRTSAEVVDFVQNRVAGRIEQDVVASPPPEWLWEDMADFVRAYLGSDCTGVIAEVPDGTPHLKLRAFVGMEDGDIEERRRDIRRAPYRDAYLTHKIARCERPFVSREGVYTVAVPLAHQGRLYGMFMVVFEDSVELDAARRTMLETLGGELGRAIAAARRGQERGQLSTATSGDLPHRLSRLMQGVEVLGQSNKQVIDAFDALPMGLMVSDMWGHIVWSNGSLRDQMVPIFPDGIPNNQLSAVLSRITGSSIEGVRSIMQTVVKTGQTSRLYPTEGEFEGTRVVLMPMRSEDTDLHAGSGTSTHLVLMMTTDDRVPAMDLLVRSA